MRLPLQVCFIKTTNLDGESNLKIRRPVDLKESAPQTKEQVSQAAGSDRDAAAAQPC